MLVILPYCSVSCRACDWAVCWFDLNNANVSCPDHQNTMFRPGSQSFGEDHQHSYGAIPVTDDMINEHGTVELWRGNRNGFA